MRLLLAEMGGNERVTLTMEGIDGLEYINMSRTDAIRTVMVEVMEDSDTRGGRTGSVSDILDDRLEDIREIFGVDEIGDRINR
jgi:hypothetical protein